MTSKDLQHLKYQRLSEPEKIILESFKGLKEYTHGNYPNCIFYKSDKGVFYSYDEDSKHLEYNYTLIGEKIYPLIGEKIYPLFGDENKSEFFIKKMVVKYLKLKVDVINIDFLNDFPKLEKHLQLKVR